MWVGILMCRWDEKAKGRHQKEGKGSMVCRIESGKHKVEVAKRT
jgi:hypothetical protein